MYNNQNDTNLSSSERFDDWSIYYLWSDQVN